MLEAIGTGIIIKAALFGLLGTLLINFIIMIINTHLEQTERKLNYKELEQTLINPPEQPMAFYCTMEDSYKGNDFRFTMDIYGLMAPGEDSLSFIYFDEKYGVREEIVFNYREITTEWFDNGSKQYSGLFSITKDLQPYYFFPDPVIMGREDKVQTNKIFYDHLQNWIKNAEERYNSFRNN